MYKKLLCILITITVLVPQFIFTTHATEVLWTFYLEDIDTGEPFDGTVYLQIRGLDSAGNKIENNYYLSNANSIYVPYNASIGFNIRTSDYTYVSPSQITTTQNQTFYISIGSTSYTSLNYAKPLQDPLFTSHFGWRVYLYGSEYVCDKHTGIDLSKYEGAQVSSICDFRSDEITVGDHSQYGNYVYTVSTRGYTVEYLHLKEEVEIADITSYTKGSPIGLQGNTGRSTNSHLHLGIRLNSVYLDPNLFTTYQVY